MVEASIREVIITLGISLAIVVFVVYLFLQQWRATLLPLLAIPTSIVGAFILFLPLGFTINTLTLFGLVLAIGIVVDDSIVMVEAIQKNMEAEDLGPAEAARRALKDMTAPIITTSLILVAVFLPVAFIPGLTGQLYQQFAMTISVSVLLSSLVALSLAPAFAASCSANKRRTKTRAGSIRSSTPSTAGWTSSSTPTATSWAGRWATAGSCSSPWASSAGSPTCSSSWNPPASSPRRTTAA